MKKQYFMVVALLAVWVLPAFSQVSNDNEDGVNKIDMRFSQQDYVPGQVLVKFKDSNRVQVRRSQGQFISTSFSSLTELLQKYGTTEMEQLFPNENPNRQLRRGRAINGEMILEKDLSQLYCIKLTDDHAQEVLQLVEELNRQKEVEYAEPNYYVYAMADNIAADYSINPMVNQQWNIGNYGVMELWNKPIINSERPVIAIIDTGVDTTHPDLKDNCVEGYDFVNNTSNVFDDNMHGTHVAGIAAACNNEIGIVGANPMALIMPIKVLNGNGVGDNATVLKGVSYAVEHGAKILNLSLGNYGYSKIEADVYRNASLSAIIVAAAGNDGKCIYASHNGLLKHGIQPSPSFPGAFSFVLGVQAVTQSGSLASFSNYDDDGPLYSCESSLLEPDGFNYELKAPGTNILSTLPGGKYGILQGTSMASPLVAGAISALMMVKEYETNDILWGDLLHTNNILEAYELTERPVDLAVTRIMLRERKDFPDETEEDYSRSYEVRAGETINIYPVVRCTFGEAHNIKMKLETDENEDPNVVQIEPGEVDFGWQLDAGGKAVSKNPLVVQIPSEIADSRHVRLKISVYCEGQDGTVSQSITLLASNMETISGEITEDRILTADQVYYVSDNIRVAEGVTLTIKPGVRMEFAKNKSLTSMGKLVANGTPAHPIVFTSHDGEETWNGIVTHSPRSGHLHSQVLYTNEDNTLFTLLPTDLTTIAVDGFSKIVYYGGSEYDPGRSFHLSDYIDDEERPDMTNREELLTDPSFLTPAVLEMLEDWKTYWNQFPTEPSEDKGMSSIVSAYSFYWYTYDDPIDTISYCRIEDAIINNITPFMKDCIIKRCTSPQIQSGIRNVLTDNIGYWNGKKRMKYSNYINNATRKYANTVELPKYSDLDDCNFFNNMQTLGGNTYYLSIVADKPTIDRSKNPSYLGTGREDLVRPYIQELGNSYEKTWGSIDLSNMRTIPVPEAHGIVWKVVVNGKDALDEYEDLAPLGVGKHKFEVYFNRPMNKDVIPLISFGIRDPWTQNAVNEDGSWNAEGTVYTAYKTITGKTCSDGENRIFVRGAEDNDFMECPYEKTRFRINVQAVGSMATGFAAEAGLGRVTLTWDNSNNDINDAMGYNVYRYSNDVTKIIPGHYDENWKWIEPIEVPDTIRINQNILGMDTSEYTDYDVIPNHTYYYLYKVLSTDLKEYDVSNIVASTPLTATLGDANGNGEVDVLDVVTTVNYVLGKKPDPFIFDAADMNADKYINVLDVVGIVQKILHPNVMNIASTIEKQQAVYTIEDGILYVESPVDLAGVQILLNASEEEMNHSEAFSVNSDLNGFEHTSAWLSDNDYMFMAFSMNGKTLLAGEHALLKIGNANISQIRLCDALGHNVKPVAGQGTTIIDTMGSIVQNQNGVFNLNGQKVTTSDYDIRGLKKGVYIINGHKVVK